MMRTVAVFALAAAGIAFASCTNEEEKPSDATRVRAVAEKLLDLHHLLGRQPEALLPEEKRAPIDPSALDALVLDRAAFDPFLGDLYVGFAVGALARHQGRWTVELRGNRAVVAAGDARLVFFERGETWKLELASSIPDAIRARANAEKARYEAARAAGRALDAR